MRDFRHIPLSTVLRRGVAVVLMLALAVFPAVGFADATGRCRLDCCKPAPAQLHDSCCAKSARDAAAAGEHSQHPYQQDEGTNGCEGACAGCFSLSARPADVPSGRTLAAFEEPDRQILAIPSDHLLEQSVAEAIFHPPRA